MMPALCHPLQFLRHAVQWAWACVLICSVAAAQPKKQQHENFVRRPALVWGGSLGAGGANYPIGPTADLAYGPLTLRFFPGLFYVSTGLQWQPGLYIKRKDCNHMPLYIGIAYHYNWLLGRPVILRERSITNQQVLMATLGARYYLNYRKTLYLDFGGGVALFADGVSPQNEASFTRNSLFPMLELRLGGFFGPVRFKKEREKLF
jgi:hypothetical protein